MDWTQVLEVQRVVGPATIAQSHQESLARFSSTLHLLTGHYVVIDRDTASVRANLVAMHLWPETQGNANSPDNYFLAGGVITAGFVRTTEGWRISQRDLKLSEGASGPPRSPSC